MRFPLAVTAGVTIFIALASPASAIDCKKASTPIEHQICGEPQLRKADAAMGTAYARLLKASPDPEIDAMLVRSQKRWLAARDNRLGGGDDSQDAPDPEQTRKKLLDAIDERSRDLSERAAGNPKLARLVEVAQEQRKFAAQFTGGPFAGFETDCDFLPSGDGSVYGCFATRHYQNKDRVCTLEQYWASGSGYEKHWVAEVVDGKLKTTAVCGDGDAGSACPLSETSTGDTGGWISPPKTSSDNADPPKPPLPKIDGEVGADEDAPWLRACLTDATYPPIAPSSESGKK